MRTNADALLKTSPVVALRALMGPQAAVEGCLLFRRYQGISRHLGTGQKEASDRDPDNQHPVCILSTRHVDVGLLASMVFIVIFSWFGQHNRDRLVCSLCSYAASVADVVGAGYLARSDAPDPLSGSPAFGVRDAAASSSTFARIGPNGPYLCCSRLKPSTYGPYGVSIGFCSRIG